MDLPFLRKRCIPLVALACVLGLLAGVSQASETDPDRAPPTATSYPESQPVLDVLNCVTPPGFDYQIDNGLYATVTAFSVIEECSLKNESKLKLKKVTGFKKDLKVRVLWQDRPAPLVVLLLGLGARDDSKLAQYWKKVMHDAGNHVLTFDSPFRPNFTERSRHGVAGNVLEEARLVGHLIEAFMAQESKDRVTKVGLVGGSYGGVLALNVKQQADEGAFKIRVDRVLAFSPPVNMQTAAANLDRFWREDRWNYTLMELGSDLMDHKPVAPGEAIPFSDSEMRAGLAAAFRLDLMDVVDANDRLFKLDKLPKPGLYDSQYRRDTAKTWTFTRYVYEMTYPYWLKKGKVRSLEELWKAGDLRTLLRTPGKGVQVVLTPDDPLNDRAELIQLMQSADPKVITLLPRGGHMGYLGTEWSRERMRKLFE